MFLLSIFKPSKLLMPYVHCSLQILCTFLTTPVHLLLFLLYFYFKIITHFGPPSKLLHANLPSIKDDQYCLSPYTLPPLLLTIHSPPPSLPHSSAHSLFLSIYLIIKITSYLFLIQCPLVFDQDNEYLQDVLSFQSFLVLHNLFHPLLTTRSFY